MVEEISTDSEEYAGSYKIIVKNKEKIIKLAITKPNMNDEEEAVRMASL